LNPTRKGCRSNSSFRAHLCKWPPAVGSMGVCSDVGHGHLVSWPQSRGSYRACLPQLRASRNSESGKRAWPRPRPRRDGGEWST
jgi:hypothetical protein